MSEWDDTIPPLLERMAIEQEEARRDGASKFIFTQNYFYTRNLESFFTSSISVQTDEDLRKIFDKARSYVNQSALSTTAISAQIFDGEIDRVFCEQALQEMKDAGVKMEATL